jgi:hypothetical protein
MSTPMHCPGFETHKELKSFTCKCPKCGKDLEIFSDEFDRPHKCPGCKEPVDFAQCAIDAGTP